MGRQLGFDALRIAVSGSPADSGQDSEEPIDSEPPEQEQPDDSAPGDTEAVDEGCGCGSSAPGWLPLLLLMALARFRRPKA